MLAYEKCMNLLLLKNLHALTMISLVFVNIVHIPCVVVTPLQSINQSIFVYYGMTKCRATNKQINKKNKS